MYCTVELHIPRRTPSVIVPSNAIVFNNVGLQVAVVENGVAHFRKWTSRVTSERRSKFVRGPAGRPRDPSADGQSRRRQQGPGTTVIGRAKHFQITTGGGVMRRSVPIIAAALLLNGGGLSLAQTGAAPGMAAAVPSATHARPSPPAFAGATALGTIPQGLGTSAAVGGALPATSRRARRQMQEVAARLRALRHRRHRRSEPRPFREAATRPSSPTRRRAELPRRRPRAPSRPVTTATVQFRCPRLRTGRLV